MTLETRLRNTGQQGGGGGGSSDSGGLAGTGGLYVVTSASPLLPNSRILVSGSSTTVRTDSTSIYVDATTGASSSSGGLAGTGMFYIMSTAQTTFPNSRQLLSGSSTTVRTDSVSIYIDATTSASASSGGLMGTANFLLTWSSDPLISNEKILTAGSSITTRTDSTAFYIDANTANVPVNSAGLLGTANFLLVWSSDPLLSNEKLLTAGSSITTRTDSTAFYIDANTANVPVNSAGLLGTANFLVVWSSDPLLSNEKLLTAGSSVIVRTDTNAIYIDATTNAPISTALGTGGFIHLPVYSAKLYPSDSAARIDAGTPTWRLMFSATTQQYGVWQFILPFDYSGSPAAQIAFSSDSSLSVAKTVSWLIDQWGYGNSQGSIYVDTFAGVNTTTIALSAGYTAGLVQLITVPLATLNSFAAGNLVKLRVSASAGAVTGNQELIGLGLFYRAGTQTIATGSQGLAGTGSFYVSWSSDPLLSNEKILTAGEAITLTTDGTTITVTAKSKDENWYKAFATGTPTTLAQSFYIGGGANNATALGTQAMSINTLTAIHFIVTRSMRVDSMAVLVTATVAGALIRLGIYTNSADHILQPFQSVSTSGNIVCTPNLLAQYQVNETLSANNLYWFILDVGTGAVTVRTLPLAGAYPILGLDSGLGTAYRVAVNTGKLFGTIPPPTWGPGFNYVTLASIPAIAVRPSI